jgi:uncharacterized delta-60 repeat protein
LDFGSATGIAEGRALAVQSDGKAIVAGYVLEGSTNRNFAVVRIIFPTAAFSAPTLDNSFGSNGIVKTDFGSDNDVANSVAVQADGKIVVAGETNNAFAVARYNSDGSPDLTFNGGKITTQLSSSGTKANALAIQGDGKIVVTGKADTAVATVRYKGDGALDPAFNGTGIVITPNTFDGAGAESIAIQADGKILVGGNANGDFNILRYNANGSPDIGYGVNGKATVDVSGLVDAAHAVMVDSTGRAVIAGEANELFGVARLQGDTAIPTPTPTPAATATPGLAGNVSTRLPVGTGDNALIEGFIVQGPAGSTKKIIVRAIGSSLTPFGIPDAVANPTLEIHDASANNATVATNDDWKTTQVGGLITGDQSAEIAASGVPPSNDLESAIIADLTPGSYTAVVRGAGDSTGTGVVDAYDLSAASPARLANVATRGLIQPGDKLMIAGFIIQNAPLQVVVRAIGPSLSAFGIGNALPDTTLQLRDADGAIVRENDDWQTDQKLELESTGLQPTNDLEAALVATIPPGQYTAQVRGKPETTGVGVVQVYFLQ